MHGQQAGLSESGSKLPHSRALHAPWPEVPVIITQYEFQILRAATRKSKLVAQRAARKE
jgi:hypothetical protein